MLTKDGTKTELSIPIQATLDVKARNKTDRSSGSGDESHSLSGTCSSIFSGQSLTNIFQTVAH